MKPSLTGSPDEEGRYRSREKSFYTKTIQQLCTRKWRSCLGDENEVLGLSGEAFLSLLYFFIHQGTVENLFGYI